MINRIIDSFVLELPNELYNKKTNNFNYPADIEYPQFDIFKDGKIRVSINYHNQISEDTGGDYDRYHTHEYSRIYYFWYDNLDKLIVDIELQKDKYGEYRFSKLTEYIWLNRSYVLTLSQFTDIMINVSNQIKEHYNQLFYKNHILD